MILLLAIVFLTPLQNSEISYVSTLNTIFYVLSFLTGLLLILSQDAKSLFFLSIIFLSYLSINHLRPVFHVALQTKAVYQMMLVLLSFNFLYLFFKKEGPLHSKMNFYVLCAIVLEACFLEQLYIKGVQISFLPLNLIADFLWIIIGAFFLYEISNKPDIKTSGMFFSFICLAFGYREAQDTVSFCLYFDAALVILFLTTVWNLIYCYYRDPVTHVFSKNAFESDSVKKFPLKYSISFFVIDSYDKLLKAFKQKVTDHLTEMIIERIKEIENEATIYRYKANEFILVFFSSDVQEAYEKMDNIRRYIAMTEFVFTQKKPLKLTITPVVSAKKRSDADANAVLLRMNEFFRPKYRFTQNMTFCEEVEQSKKIKRINSRS